MEEALAFPGHATGMRLALSWHSLHLLGFKYGDKMVSSQKSLLGTMQSEIWGDSQGAPFDFRDTH
jgi:hypothetical protein